MTESDLILEQLLILSEKAGTGIYMKRLDSGREVYTAKCPVCGLLHGGFKTFDEAKRNIKCREHFRKEIEKLRKEVEKVDKPKKQKDLFKNKPAKAVVGESEESDDLESIRDVGELAPDSIRYEIFDGREYYPVSRDGYIGRQGWKIAQLSKQWKIEGIEIGTEPGVYMPWARMKEALEQGENLHGYVIDRDHGTLRQWGRDAGVYKKSVNEAELDVQSILTATDLSEGDVSKFACETARPGQEFWHRYQKHADGSPISVRVSGPCLTWEDRPDEYKLPVKYGLFQTFYITENNAGEYTTIQPGGRGGGE